MRFRRLTAATAGCAALLTCAGCGSGTTIGSSAPTGTPNGEAAKDAATIFADSVAAMKTATSVHLNGPVAGIFFDADLGKGNFSGTANQGGKVFDIVYLADPGGNPASARIFVRASAAVWTTSSSPAIGRCVGDVWLTLDPASAGAAASAPQGVDVLTSDAGQLGDLAAFATAIGTSPGTLSKGATGAVGGTSVIAVTSNSGASAFVATQGPPYLFRLSGISSGQSQTLDFSNWNAAVSFAAPGGARSLTTVLAGCPGAATPAASPTP